MDHTLGYEKHDDENKETDNRRNGQSSKTVRSELGEIELDVPHDRNGESDSIIVKKHQKNISSIEE